MTTSCTPPGGDARARYAACRSSPTASRWVWCPSVTSPLIGTSVRPSRKSRPSSRIADRELGMAGKPDLIVRELLDRYGCPYAEQAGLRLADPAGPQAP